MLIPVQDEVGGFVVFLLAAALAPLFVFTPQLVRAKREGLAEYGNFASSYVTDFDQKWLRSKVNDERVLGTGHTVTS